MIEKEISELYVRLAFQYESAIDALLAKEMIDTNLVAVTKEKFYDSLNEENFGHLKKPGTIMKLYAFT